MSTEDTRDHNKRDRLLLTVKREDDYPTLEATLTDADGEVIDLSDPGISTIEVHADHVETGTAVINATATVVDAPAGKVEYPLNKTETAREGRHYLEFVIQYTDGRTRTVPQSGYYYLDVDQPVSRGELDPGTIDGSTSVSVGYLSADEAVIGTLSVTNAPVDADDAVRKAEHDTKADQTAVDSLSATVGAKADKDGGGTGTLTNYASIGTDETSIATHDDRPLWSSADRYISVPGDYGSIQAAVNDLPFYLAHRYEITVDGSYDGSAEDIVVPPTVGARLGFGGGSETILLRIAGNETNYPVINSILFDTVLGMAAQLKWVEVAGGNPWTNEDAAIEAYGCRGRVQIVDVDISHIGSDGIVSYASDVTLDGTIDFGTGLQSVAMEVKHMGNIAAPSTPLEGAVNGDVFGLSAGQIHADVGSPLVANSTGFSRSSRGVVYDTEGSGIYTTGEIPIGGKTRKDVAIPSGSSTFTPRHATYYRLVHEDNPGTLTTIDGTHASVGDSITVRTSPPITIEHGTGNIRLGGSSNFTTSSGFDNITFRWDGGVWMEIARMAT